MTPTPCTHTGGRAQAPACREAAEEAEVRAEMVALDAEMKEWYAAEGVPDHTRVDDSIPF